MTIARSTERALLLTGVPGIGKTTILRKVAESLAELRVRGFITDEIREGGARVGFRITSLDGTTATMAHVAIQSRHRVGKYGVDIAALDQMVEAVLAPDADADVYLVDEIGKMECLSPRFVAALRALLSRRQLLAATVALRGRGFIDEVKRAQGVALLEVTRENRDALPARVVAWIQSRALARAR